MFADGGFAGGQKQGKFDAFGFADGRFARAVLRVEGQIDDLGGAIKVAFGDFAVGTQQIKGGGEVGDLFKHGQFRRDLPRFFRGFLNQEVVIGDAVSAMGEEAKEEAKEEKTEG